ncbi:MAG TPA: proton-conducting transporter membrane subunit [Sporichthyaceae bacterium]|nr:proton-conducting transporter membrane subunit [Sporichthyaceae bacterium]
MNPAGAGLGFALGLGATAAVAGLLVPRRSRPVIVGLGTAACGAAAVVAGVAGLSGRTWVVWLPQLLPLTGARLAIDPLAGLFIAITGAVAVCAAIFGIGYTAVREELTGRVPQAVFPLFVTSLLLVPAAAGVGTLLAAWELMALTSLLLVLTEHRRGPEVASAGRWYAVMTHLSLVAVLLGLVGFAAAAGGDSFAALRAGHLSGTAGGAVFLATLVGFAAKSGIVPLHVWLPRAHPEAPAHVSMLMSAAMVTVGIYGIVRVGLDLLGGGPGWWWLVVLGLGAVSALYGALQAAVATDLKRLLACSTTENMGLVLIGVGAAGYFNAVGAAQLAGLALTAALLHLVAHAAFKALLFGAAGSVVHATGTRDLDALGGLRAAMPATTALFALGALGACALPLGAGFAGEWLLLQALLHALPVGGTVTAVMVPLLVAVIALTAGLSIVAFVKAFGVGFLARPRSPGAAAAHESGRPLRGGLGVAGAACVLLGLWPGLVAGHLTRAVAAAGIQAPAVLGGGVMLRLQGMSGSSGPLLLTILVAAASWSAAGAARVALRGRARRPARLWDCGAGPATPRMQYTATAFAEPLTRVFEDVLRPETDLEVTPNAESAYYPQHLAYRQRVADRVEDRLYLPVLRALSWVGGRSRRLADGRVHRYLSYGFVGFVGLLIGLAVTR